MQVKLDVHTSLIIAGFCEEMALFCEEKKTEADARRAEAFWVVRNYIHDNLEYEEAVANEQD